MGTYGGWCGTPRGLQATLLLHNQAAVRFVNWALGVHLSRAGLQERDSGVWKSHCLERGPPTRSAPAGVEIHRHGDARRGDSGTRHGGGLSCWPPSAGACHSPRPRLAAAGIHPPGRAVYAWYCPAGVQDRSPRLLRQSWVVVHKIEPLSLRPAKCLRWLACAASLDSPPTRPPLLRLVCGRLALPSHYSAYEPRYSLSCSAIDLSCT